MAAHSITVSTSPIVLLGCSSNAATEYLAATLESWHYQVELAHNGTEALARLECPTPPAIAILDMDLPAPAPADVIREVRSRQDLRRTWTILLSTSRDNERLRTALQSGCDDFLVVPSSSGPFDPADLRLRIRVAERVLALSSRVQKQSAELRYHVTHDGLTGLWNREALISLIFQETDRVQRMKTPLSLMLLDLDNFSRINHDYSYETGDRILIELANRFRRQLRSYDLIGRCGEDEFLIALPGCTFENALRLAGRVREHILARPFPAEQDVTTVTASIGIAVSRGRSPLVVLHEAERALAEAKLDGKNCARGYAPETPPHDLLLSVRASESDSAAGPSPDPW